MNRSSAYGLSDTEDGPFSVFPGIDRCAVLLGDGRIMLTGATDARYLRPLQPLSFAGEAQWHARWQTY